MAQCSSCGASLSDDAVFCGACGKSVTSPAAPVSQATASPQPARVVSPDTAQAMRQAASHAQNVAKNLGPEKIISIAGGALGILGCVLPFYNLPTDSLLGGADLPSATLIGQGGNGFWLIVMAILLGATPLLMVPSRLISLIGFGLASGVLGVLIGDRSGFATMGQSIPIDFGIGFYLALLGFAALAYGHGRRASEAP